MLTTTETPTPAGPSSGLSVIAGSAWLPMPNKSGFWWYRSGDHMPYVIRIEILHSGEAWQACSYLNILECRIFSRPHVRYAGPIFPPNIADEGRPTGGGTNTESQ